MAKDLEDRREVYEQAYKLEEAIERELKMALISHGYKAALLRILVAINEAKVFICRA